MCGLFIGRYGSSLSNVPQQTPPSSATPPIHVFRATLTGTAKTINRAVVLPSVFRFVQKVNENK